MMVSGVLPPPQTSWPAFGRRELIGSGGAPAPLPRSPAPLERFGLSVVIMDEGSAALSRVAQVALRRPSALAVIRIEIRIIIMMIIIIRRILIMVEL